MQHHAALPIFHDPRRNSGVFRARFSAFNNLRWHLGCEDSHKSLMAKVLLNRAGLAAVLSAIERRESRGGHFRDDYPDKDPASAKWNSVIKRNADGSMNYRKEPIPALPAELAAIIEEQSK